MVKRASGDLMVKVIIARLHKTSWVSFHVK